MGLINLPSLDDVLSAKDTKTQMEMLVNTVGLLMKSLSEINGYLGNMNIKELTADKLTAGTINTGDITIGADDSGKFYRIDGEGIVANNGSTDTMKFDLATGLLTLVSILLKSSDSNEKVAMDATGFHAYDATGVERITIGTTPAKGAKALITRNTAGTEQGVYTYDSETVDGASRTGQYVTAHGAYLLFDTNGDVRLQASDGKGFRAVSGTPEMNDGFGWSTIAKQSDVTSKATAGADTSTVGNHNHGIPDLTKLATTSDGVTVSGFVTWSASGGHFHTQT